MVRSQNSYVEPRKSCTRLVRSGSAEDIRTVGWGHHPWNGSSHDDRHAADGMQASESMLSATLTRIADACQRRTAKWPGHLCMSTLAMLSCKSDTCAVHVRYRKIFREIYTYIILRDPYQLAGAAWSTRASRAWSGGSHHAQCYAYADCRPEGCQDTCEALSDHKHSFPDLISTVYDVFHLFCVLGSQSDAGGERRDAMLTTFTKNEQSQANSACN